MVFGIFFPVSGKLFANQKAKGKQSFMKKRFFKLHIGLRTLKTAAAVILSMVIVDTYGTTSSKLIFAMLGAMSAVQPTFRDSLESCLTEIVGVLFGAFAGIILLTLSVPYLAAAGIGIIFVITMYNGFSIRFSPGLPCFIVVMLCTSKDISPVPYAFGRIWDTAIGLAVGTLINLLVFPYDNSRKIRSTLETLDRELILFLEDLFDGDDILPDAGQMSRQIADMNRQLHIFSDQKLLLHLQRQQEELAAFQLCEKKARELAARLEILSHVEHPGRLDAENRRLLARCGAEIRDPTLPETGNELDIVTNYHIRQILKLRSELLNALDGNKIF